MEEILVSIVCVTYNHESYIMDALKGFLSQKTDFKYEIIIHDDASTDKTTDIIRDFEALHGDMIRVIYQKENQYSKMKSFWFLRDIYSKCKGKYIAFCEGDDFWIDSHKLQIQVDFLEKHSNYILSSHNAVRLNCEDGTVEAVSPYDCDKMLSPEEIIMQYHGNVPSASIVMRTDALTEMEDLFWEYDVGDWLLQLSCITKGKIYYFDRVMSVYRFRHEGSWTLAQAEDIKKHFEHGFKMVEFLEKYNKYTNNIYEKFAVARIQGYINDLLNLKKEKEEIYLAHYIQHQPYLEEFERVYMQTFVADYYEPKLKKYILEHKHIVIFGAGDYAARLAKQLNRQQVLFDGFVVSDWKKDGKNYFGKPIWHISKIPFQKNGTGVVIAISPVIWNQLVDYLGMYDITDYMCPFLFEV